MRLHRSVNDENGVTDSPTALSPGDRRTPGNPGHGAGPLRRTTLGSAVALRPARPSGLGAAFSGLGEGRGRGLARRLEHPVPEAPCDCDSAETKGGLGRPALGLPAPSTLSALGLACHGPGPEPEAGEREGTPDTRRACARARDAMGRAPRALQVARSRLDLCYRGEEGPLPSHPGLAGLAGSPAESDPGCAGPAGQCSALPKARVNRLLELPFSSRFGQGTRYRSGMGHRHGAG